MRLWLLAVLLPAAALAQTPDGLQIGGLQIAGRQIALHGNATGALPCAACHGVGGQGNTSIGAPELAGLPPGVIVGALQNFAQGQGGNAMMQNIAAALSPAEMREVAAYYAKMSR